MEGVGLRLIMTTIYFGRQMLMAGNGTRYDKHLTIWQKFSVIRFQIHFPILFLLRCMAGGIRKIPFQKFNTFQTFWGMSGTHNIDHNRQKIQI